MAFVRIQTNQKVRLWLFFRYLLVLYEIDDMLSQGQISGKCVFHVDPGKSRADEEFGICLEFWTFFGTMCKTEAHGPLDCRIMHSCIMCSTSLFNLCAGSLLDLAHIGGALVVMWCWT